MDNKEANVVVITKFIAYFPPSILLFGRGITAKEGLFFNHVIVSRAVLKLLHSFK